MNWSKARQLLEERFTPDMQGRVSIHMTRYRHAHDQEGELWLTVDGSKAYGTSYYQFVRRRNELEPPSPDLRPTFRHEDAERRLVALGVVDHMRLASDLISSLSLSVDDMLRSPHPLIRAMAALDRRMGQRRLVKIDLEAEHELVRLAISLRRKDRRRAEGDTSRPSETSND